MTTGFQQQDQTTYFAVVRTTRAPQQVGQKLAPKPAVSPRVSETKTFK